MKEISLYVHIPFCVKKCDYCDFLSGVYDEQMQREYTNSLCREIAYMGQQLEAVAVSSIYIGGGTPSWLNIAETEKMMQALHASFAIRPDAEITIECNPGTVTWDKFASYRKMGINRLSIGLQSANDDELALLGRVHTYERFLHTYDMARKSGFYNINVDVMTGLPGQTLDKLMHTLTQVIALRPEHISAYALMVEEGTPFYERYKFDAVLQHAGKQTEFLPNEDEEYRLYKMTQQVLQEHGYHQYEISNYAREDYECFHNTVYWTRRPYLGLGLGAASLIEEKRTSNVRDIYVYCQRCNGLSQAEHGEHDIVSPLWDEVTELSRKDAMEEFMFLGLRMNRGVKRTDFTDTFGCSIEAVYGDVLKRLREEALLVLDGGRFYLTERGQDLSNYALAQFLLEDETDLS